MQVTAAIVTLEVVGGPPLRWSAIHLQGYPGWSYWHNSGLSNSKLAVNHLNKKNIYLFYG